MSAEGNVQLHASYNVGGLPKNPPKVGSVRIYRDRIDVLYPGESATVHLKVDRRTGQQTAVYQVYPTPGPLGWWRRFRYRWL